MQKRYQIDKQRAFNILPISALPTCNLRSQKPTGNFKTGGVVPVEIRVVAEENKALQSVGLEEHFARYPFSFARELGKSVDGLDDGPVISTSDPGETCGAIPASTESYPRRWPAQAS
jgi:hypothetical protein